MTDKITIDRAAVQQALEALEKSQAYVEASANKKLKAGWGAQLDRAEDAINVIRAALEAPPPAPQIFLADVRKVRDALDPDDWCGDERMIDVLDRALAEKPCCANWAAGTSCFADPRPGCPMLTTPQAPPQAPPRQPLTDQEIDDLYINGTKHWIGKREIARAVEALITKGPTT